MTEIDWLQEWYVMQCDGDWEHRFGIEISTLDNPGWRVTIDLSETMLEGSELEDVAIERSEEDWVHYGLKANQFSGACGPHNLTELLEGFRHFAESVGP